MSFRNEVHTAIITSLAQLFPSYTVAIWSGEEEAFNTERQFPAIFVSYTGASISDDEEVGCASRTWERELQFVFFIACLDTEANTQAEEILETIEEELHGRKLSNASGDYLGVTEMRQGFEDGASEALIEVREKQVLYAQAWRVVSVISV